ncbi:hypothetical protein GCM10027570_13560 [Streptomonospora sediminis]
MHCERPGPRTARNRRAGALLTYEGWGHWAAGHFSGSGCVSRRVEGYLIGTEPPAPGTSCPAVPYEPG